MSLALPVRLPARSPRLTDAAVATVLALPVMGSLIARATRRDEPLVLLVGLAALAAIPLCRRRPVSALILALAAAAALPGVPPLLLPALVVLYSIATTEARPVAVFTGVVVAFVAIVSKAVAGTGDLINHAIGDSAGCAAAVALGLYVGAQRRVVVALRDRSERLDRERELLADRAVVEERVRIAQELHDVSAHSVSLMVVQAQALGATVGDERVARATDAIADLGRQAMAEMHRTLKLLRADHSEAAELTPQPGLASLDRLIEQSRAAGLDVNLTIEGEPRPLSQGVDLSAFRIVQEALTNVIKHAGGAHATVTLSYRTDELEITVIDDGDRASAARSPRSPEGHGVIGMRERAALFGGTLKAEPRLDQGFKVTAMLRYEEPSS